MRTPLRFVITVGLLALALFAKGARASDDEAFFENEVRPLLLERCTKCHGAQKSESGLRLDARAFILRGGDAGPAAIEGKPEESLLIRAVRHEGDVKMPPRKKLADREIEVLERWVKLGMPWPHAEESSGGGALRFRSGEITEQERAHWSFQPVKPANTPNVRDASWPRTPIDRFILAKLERNDLAPVSDANKRTLLRRATFGLIGLPPTPEEIAAFLDDDRPGALDRVVERLLDSPHYGERWGRHWLDVARYADTAGETADFPVPLAWKYRNWVIDAFNADKPYDEFIREQLAGDIIANSAPRERYEDLLTATGFLAVSRRFGFGIEEFHYLTIQDSIDTTGQAFLGLTIGCARCHDHKFDPINAEDYYAWYGIFESSNYSLSGDEKSKKQRRLHPDVRPDVAKELDTRRKSELASLEKELARVTEEKNAIQSSVGILLGDGADMDPGFELQSLGTPPKSPWTAHTAAEISTKAQSPYENVFFRGTRGIATPGLDANTHFGRKILPPRKAADTPKIWFNIDFRNVPQPAGSSLPDERITGAYRFYLGRGPGHSGAVEMGASSRHFFVKNGEKGYQKIRDLELGRWYNLQLGVDLRTKTYSGTIGFPGSVTRFENISFTPNWDGVIDQFFVDRFGPRGGPTPARHLDNVSIRTTPIRPVEKRAGDDTKELRIDLAAPYFSSRALNGSRRNTEGHEGVHVWSPPGKPLPIVGMNMTKETKKIPGTARPGKIFVHPDQKDGVGIAWRSPISGKVRITGRISDAHDCGDSVVWHMDHLGVRGFSSLAEGAVEKNSEQSLTGKVKGKLDAVEVEVGDYLQLIVLPKGNYGCDLTQVELRIDEIGGTRSWSLEEDFARANFASNPHGDRHGNERTWAYFVSPPDRGRSLLASTFVTVSPAELRERRAKLAKLDEKILEIGPRVAALKKEMPYGRVYGVIEGTKPSDAVVQLRGDPKKPGKLTPRRNLEILGGEKLSEPTKTSGRLELANWIARPENPLTARVMVNRIWQYHFGSGLVETANDFGTRGHAPSHPELLDWLASEFVKSGWSVKHMHRLILKSRVYGLASRPRTAVIDESSSAAWLSPEREDTRRKLFGRYSHRRLEAEAIRDAMLTVSGKLDRRPGKEHPFPPSSSWGFTQHGPFYATYPTNKRSVYLMTQRLKRHPFLTLFDGADTNASTARRTETTTPTQALFLLNSEFVHEQGMMFARRLQDEGNDHVARIRAAFEHALGRPANGEEVARSLAFVETYRDNLASTGTPEPERESAAWSAFTRTLLVRNEFLFVE